MRLTGIATTFAVTATLLLSGCQSAEPKPEAPDPVEQVLEESIQQAEARGGQAAQPAVAAPPPAVLESLLPPLQVDLGGRAQAEPRFDITVDRMEAGEFFMGLVQETPYSMTIAPGVTGTISLSLKNVTVDEVMEVVRNTYGYEFQRTRHGYQILPIRMQTRIFHVNHLNVLRSGESGTTVSAGRQESSDGAAGGGGQGGTKGTSISTRQTEGAFWAELERSIATIIGADINDEGIATDTADTATEGAAEDPLAALLGAPAEATAPAEPTAAGPASRRGVNGRSVAVNPHTGLVVVRAMPLELREVETFLNETQASIGRQVILEAKILEVELSDGYQQGINWAALAGGRETNLLAGQYPERDITNLRHPTTDSFNPWGSPIVDFEYDGDTQTHIPGPPVADELSGYRLTPGIQDIANLATGGIFSVALRIKDFAAFIDLLETQGDVHVLSSPRVSTVNNQKAVIKVGSDEFFVTGVSSTTDDAGNTSPEIELESFFSGVALDVTPQVAPNGMVTLHIHPTVVEVTDQTKTFTVYNQTQQLPLAHSTTRESDSIVRAVNGQVVVIGGLLKEVKNNKRSATPVLGDLPGIGGAFRHQQDSAIKSELVILLRPIVVDGNRRWTESLRQTRQSFRRLREGSR